MHTKSARCFAVLLLSFLLSAMAVASPTVTLTGLTPTNFTIAPGGSQTFTGTLTNTGSVDVGLIWGNWDGPGLNTFMFENLSSYLTLTVGQSFTGSLATLVADPGATLGNYAGDLGFGYYDLSIFNSGQLCDGYNSTSVYNCWYYNKTAFEPYLTQPTVPFTYTVSNAVGTPEPQALFLLATGFIGFALKKRWR